MGFRPAKGADFSLKTICLHKIVTNISKTSAVLREMQHNKIYLALLYEGCRYVKEELGYDNMIYHFQCEQRSTFKRFDSTIESNEKRYAVFSKEL